MGQQAADVSRFAQIIDRYRALIGVMALLGLLGGAVFAVLNPPVFTSRALALLAPSWCPQGAICGGPAFTPGPRSVMSPGPLPSGVQVAVLPGDELMVTARAGSPAQAEAAANAVAISYLSYDVAQGYPGWPASARILQTAATASGTPAWVLLRDDLLLGVVAGLLLGVVAALAAGGSTIDNGTAPPGYDVGGKRRAGQQIRYATTGLALQQMRLEYVNPLSARDSTPGRPGPV